MPPRLRAWLIVTVTAVWGLNFTAPIFIKGYLPKPELNVAFMAVLGILTMVDKNQPPPSDDDEGR